MSYKAEYQGDANYPARTGACEPLTVTPVPQPAIAIVKNPKSQTVAVGGTATFSITVTNAGNMVLTNVKVMDPLSPKCNRTKADIPALASMAPGGGCDVYVYAAECALANSTTSRPRREHPDGAERDSQRHRAGDHEGAGARRRS